jgi:hypothetical protein
MIWDQFTLDELNYEKCSFEPSASAVVLKSYGNLKMSSEREVTIEYHFRLKVLDENAAKDMGDVVIDYWTDGDMETILSLEAQTVNPVGKGSFNRFPVAKNQIFDVKVNKNEKEIRFSFPNVTKGSILEYKYTKITKNLFWLEGWKFSQNIPVLYSEFRAELFSNMTYNVVLQGAHLQQKYIGKKTTGFWVLENIGSLKREPFVANLYEHHNIVSFQLREYYNYHTRRNEKVLTDWQKFSKETMQSANYDNFMDDKETPNEVFALLRMEEKDDLSKIKILHQYVRDNFEFNGNYWRVTDQSRKNFESKKKGNNVEINSYLGYLLKQAGLKVNMVMISTRDHGKITKDYPLLSQFNHYLVLVHSQDKQFLLDATNPLLPYNILPINMLNGEGFILDKEKSEWITINPNVSRKNTFCTIDLSDLSKPNYQASYKYQDYAAYNMRRSIKDEGLDNLKKRFDTHTDLKLEEFVVSGLDSVEKPLEIKVKYSYNDLNADILYFNPLIWNYITENPFNTDKRNLPIEFPYKEEFKVICTIKLPDNLTIQDLPKNTKVLLPEKMGEYIYLIGQVNNSISISIKYAREKGILVPEFYTALKEFYTQLLAKQQEQVVLRKK